MSRRELFDCVRLFAPDHKFTQAMVTKTDELADLMGYPPDADAPINGFKAHALTDPAAFFAKVREQFGTLHESQVGGFNGLLAAMKRWDVYDTAYGLATAWHETRESMLPVAEAYWIDNAEAWRKKNLRYYPWYGRGYPQTTWEVNYKRADKELGLNGSLIANPDRMLEPEIAAQTMVRGMEEGWFTGKKNSDFERGDYVGRRRIINGTDKASLIAGYARAFEDALTAGGW